MTSITKADKVPTCITSKCLHHRSWAFIGVHATDSLNRNTTRPSHVGIRTDFARLSHDCARTVWPVSCVKGENAAGNRGADSRWRREHTVDDVHDTVGRTDICLDDLGVLDCDRPRNLVNVDLLSLEGLDILGCLQILCANSGSRNHMVLEDGLKLLDVLRLEQGSQRSLGKGGDEVASFERRGESRELGDARCELDDVLGWCGS